MAQPKLQENPREWQKFTLVICLAMAAACCLMHRRQWLPSQGLFWILLALSYTILLCAFIPRWFRGFYRAGMTASFHVGQVMGRILLTIIFWIIITPLGLLLRLQGKDLLKTKRDPAATSYWQPTRGGQDFDRLF